MPNVAEIRALLQWYVAMGVDESIAEEAPNRFNAPERPAIAERTPSIQEVVALKPAPLVAPEPTASLAAAIAEARAAADRATTLDALRQEVGNFEACPLKKMAKNTVFGDGNPASKIMFIGEAPGAEEDKMGIPFCGPSGQLLDEMLRFIGLIRAENFYITNSIFWRPPGNRAPTNEEIEICKPLVEKHIALINPEMLILVGGTAANALLGGPQTMSRIRTQKFTYINQYIEKSIHTRAIFHPSYLLRQPLQKKLAWFDLLAIQDDIRSQGK